MWFTGDDDGKDDALQPRTSVREEYEPISDDELDEILADSQKKEEQPDDEKLTGSDHLMRHLNISSSLTLSWTLRSLPRCSQAPWT